MATETELKFRANGPEALERLAAVESLGEATLGAPMTHDEEDRYLDTDEGRMALARWACRLRTRAGAVSVSLKGSAEATDGALHRRPEVEGPAVDELDPTRWPPSRARDLVDRLRDGRPLRERFRLRQQRTERAVSVEGQRLGVLSLDRVEVVAHGGSRGVLHVVELELDRAGTPPEDAARLMELARALGDVAGLAPERRTKLEHALAILAE